MPFYTIDNFWRARLPVQRPTVSSLVPGWSIERAGYPTFKEAPLSLSAELSLDDDPECSSILLVSAPGAVGKSTLARQIAYVTGAVYVDLAKAEPVGGNSISGGLVKSGLYANWESRTTSLLIDGLDEARLRVTNEAFEAFLTDVAQLSIGRSAPIVLFGRTGAIQDTWLLLEEAHAKSVVLEIGFYDANTSAEFASALVQAARPDSKNLAVERHAVELLLKKLREQTEGDGDRFAGYAPVLQAVARRVANEDNPAALIAQIEKGAQPVTLQTVVSSILDRERSKLDGLQFEEPGLAQRLYLPEEQLDRLVARIYQIAPPDLPPMKPADAHRYSTALDTWVAEHPFLNGSFDASSAVFDAIISIRALRNSASAEQAVRRQLQRGAAANPFLSEFYLPEDGAAGQLYLPPDHIGIVYSSMRARLSLGDSASLLVEGMEDAEQEDVLKAEVEISVARKQSDRPRVLRFETEQTGVLRLGSYVEDVELNVPHTRVEIGPGSEAVLVAPVSIQCQQLAITADKVVAESPRSLDEAIVYLEAEHFDGTRIMSVPTLRGKVSLAVAWPGARTHPWTSFATSPTPSDDPRVDEALRRFRKFVIAFRSHSKGNLARYQHKIEHARMTKGAGQSVLDQMRTEGILSLKGTMYYLDPKVLGVQAGATYADCMARKFSPEAVAFVKRSFIDQIG